MKIERKSVFAAMVFVSTLLWMYLLNASGFSLKNALLLANYATTALSLISPSFILSVIFFTLPLVFAAIAVRKIENINEAKIYCTGAAIAAVLIGIIAFQRAAEHWLIFAFYLGSFPIIMESADLSFKELKKFVIPRATANAVKKANLLVAVGLFLASALIVLPNQDYVKSFETGILNTMSTSSGGNFDLSEPLTQQIVQTQKQSLQTITQLQSFGKLRTKDDVDVMTFVATIDQLTATISSPEYRQTIKEQVKKNQEQLLQGPGMGNTIELVKQQIPELKKFEELLWLFEAVLAASIFLPLSNLITPLLAMLFGTITDKIIKDPEKAS